MTSETASPALPPPLAPVAPVRPAAPRRPLADIHVPLLPRPRLLTLCRYKFEATLLSQFQEDFSSYTLKRFMDDYTTVLSPEGASPQAPPPQGLSPEGEPAAAGVVPSNPRIKSELWHSLVASFHGLPLSDGLQAEERLRIKTLQQVRLRTRPKAVPPIPSLSPPPFLPSFSLSPPSLPLLFSPSFSPHASPPASTPGLPPGLPPSAFCPSPHRASP